jgi:hypothetical protein
MGRGQAESSGLRERAFRTIYLPRLDPRRRKRGDRWLSAATSRCDRIGRLVRVRTYDDLFAAAPRSLSGKIAVVTQRMVRAQDGSGYGAANPIRRRGPSEAARRGAVGYPLRSLGTDSHRLPRTVVHEDGIPRIPAALAIPDAEQLEPLAAQGTAIRPPNRCETSRETRDIS